MPTSNQEKGIDLILYNRKASQNKVVTIQVKSSRTYIDHNKRKKAKNQQFKYHLWLNRFEVQENADLYFLIGIYPNIPNNIDDVNTHSVKWVPLILVFTNVEMKDFLKDIKLKNSDKEDRMFAFGFNDEESIHLTRGCPTPKPMAEFLLNNRLHMIKEMLL